MNFSWKQYDNNSNVRFSNDDLTNFCHNVNIVCRPSAAETEIKFFLQTRLLFSVKTQQCP